MDSLTQSASAAARLPAQRIDAAGGAHVDQRAVLALALPLMANSAVQIVLNLTDMWFMGHISTQALAAVGAVQWLIVAVVLVLGGAGMAVQTLVAQSDGARRYRRAAQAVWTALWAMACAVPLFVLVGAARHLILAPFGFDPQIEQLASAFWFPRVGGAVVGAAVWAMFGFFNGVGRPRVTLAITILITVTNALFNQVFIFGLGLGYRRLRLGDQRGAAGGAAVRGGDVPAARLSAPLLLTPDVAAARAPHAAAAATRRADGFVAGGGPAGVLHVPDDADAARHRRRRRHAMVMMLTSIAYMPGFGIASAGTTLVGQSIGAGARDWALRVGNRVILLAALYMGGIGVLIALGGRWMLPFFTGAHDADAAAAVVLGTQLLWLAAAYQFFDGLNLGSSMCLRGAGDVRVPAALVLPVSLLLFVPLAHAFTFAPGQGWVHFLPQFGWGALGGWVAVLIYVMVLGTALFLRWRSRAWQAIRI